MQQRPPTMTLQILVLLGISFFAGAANAFQLGEVSGHSRTGEPLNAAVGLWLSPKDKQQPIRFKIDPDHAYTSNPELTAIVKRMEAGLVPNPDGSAYVSLKTAEPIAEPIVAFRLKMFVGDEARMRNFALALTPSTVAERAHASTQQKPISSPRPSAKRSSISTSTYTVARGDTLWGIARRVGQTDGAATANLVQEIFSANPHAFVNDNQDQLILGARLNLPVVATPSVAEPATIKSLPTPTAQIESAPATTLATLEQHATGTQAFADAPNPVRWQDRNPELAAELEALTQKYAAIRSRYGLQSSIAQTEAVVSASPTTDATETVTPSSASAGPPAVETPAAADLQAIDDSPTVASTALPIKEQLQSEPPTTSAPSASSADETVTSGGFGMTAFLQSLNTFWASIPFFAIFAILSALVAVVGLVWVTQRGVTNHSSRRADQKLAALEQDRKADVARKAKNRIEMEAEVKRMLDERDKNSAPIAREQRAADSGFAAETEQSLEATIDLNIAHGRYTEAETLLTKVITSTPRNYSAKLRLVEVFYMTERIEEFCALAEDLHQNHRSDMADEEWRRVIRMGKIIAPDRVPFSGPRAVENPTQVS